MKFRLISKDYPGDPYKNLALDEAIFTEVREGRSPPTFRFYRNANAVILGCFQTAEEEVDLEYAEANGIKIAKRITGGGRGLPRHGKPQLRDNDQGRLRYRA